MGLSSLLETLKNILNTAIEAFREFTASLLYQYRRIGASGKQAECLPTSYREYRHYKTTYGIAPGDAITMEEHTGIVASVSGPPTINAQVEYIDLDNGVEYTTGLANILRQT